MSESSVEIIARLEAKLLEKTERVVALEARLDRAIEELKKIRQVIYRG